MAARTFKQDVAAIFGEAFSGLAAGADGTWFVQAGEAFFETLDRLDASQASLAVAPGVNTIAAHVIHTAYYIELAIAVFNGNELPGDWPGSWKKQTVTEGEWAEVKATLHERVSSFLQTLDAVDLAAGPYLQADAIANAAHAAYHLGAVRQLYLIVTSDKP
ncbi:MAG TPA: DinB family protein [Capsulimonadaceae bacterium]|jgi:hypothetical protein